ncbi:MAG: hypothetical protein KF780_06800 [Sphingomonas sp.]|nr:hypothetical protein [Sphingomonas sp.]
MRKVLVSIALASATVASTAVVVSPAMAQPGRGYQQPNRGHQQAIHREIRQDINELERRIQQAQQRRTISPREAQGLRREAIQIRQLYNRFSRNGLDRREVRELEQRINRVHRQLRFQQRDWDRRWR